MSRRGGLAAGLLCALGVAGCPAQPAAIAPVVAPGLGLPSTATGDIDLAGKFDDALPVHLRGDAPGAVVKLAACADYEKVRARVNGSDSELDYGTVKYEGARCDAMAVLKQATAATRSALPPGRFLDWRSAQLYPATLWAAFADEEFARLAAPSATLQTASGKASLKAVSDRFLELEDRAAGIHMTLLGLGDVDHDGWQDAVVLVEGYAKGGSNTTARAAVLTRRESDKGLREVPLERVLR